MHFRTQDIDELGRRLGLGSEPELQLGDSSSDPIIPLATDDDDEQIEIGRDMVRGSGTSSGPSSPKSSKKIRSTPAAKPSDPGSLELDSSDEFIPLSDDRGSGKRKAGDSSTRLKKSSDSDIKLEGRSGVRARRSSAHRRID